MWPTVHVFQKSDLDKYNRINVASLPSFGAKPLSDFDLILFSFLFSFFILFKSSFYCDLNQHRKKQC